MSFKNWTHSKSDLIITLLIVLVAGAIIYNRVGAIMDFKDMTGDVTTGTTAVDKTPTAANASNPTKEIENTDSSAAKPTETTSGAATTEKVPPATATPTDEEPAPATKGGKIHISTGSSSEGIANKLKAKGYISDVASFLTTLSKMKAETLLRAGTFTIPAGSSNEQIIKIMTGRA